MLKMRVVAVPARVSSLAPGPVRVRLSEMLSSPWLSVMVPLRPETKLIESGPSLRLALCTASRRLQAPVLEQAVAPSAASLSVLTTMFSARAALRPAAEKPRTNRRTTSPHAPRARRANSEFIDNPRKADAALPRRRMIAVARGLSSARFAFAPSPPTFSRPRRNPHNRRMTSSAPPRDPWFDRPIVVLSPPRSGSTLLFETLARAPGLYTNGGDSHALKAGQAALQ